MRRIFVLYSMSDNDFVLIHHFEEKPDEYEQ